MTGAVIVIALVLMAAGEPLPVLAGLALMALVAWQTGRTA